MYGSCLKLGQKPKCDEYQGSHAANKSFVVDEML